MKINMTVLGTGEHACALSQKTTECVQVQIANDPPCWLSWKSLKAILQMRFSQNEEPVIATPLLDRAAM